MGKPLTAVEFFSGIGAFADACAFSGIEVVAAFDQNEHANKVYESNFGLSPVNRNIETLSASEVPEADIWWLSPPCTPFSRRGKQLDDDDPRSRALLNLISILPDVKPDYFFMENVEGFAGSRMHGRLDSVLEELGYKQLSVKLCSSMLGVPMRRPRYFIAASRLVAPRQPDLEVFTESRSLPQFLTRNQDADLILPAAQVEKYKAVLNIVDFDDQTAYVICFTRGYYKCRKASGSMVRLASGDVRFVAPEEILQLFGFSRNFRFPDSMPLPVRWKLVGNSVDVRSVKTLINCLAVPAAKDC